MQVEQLQDAFRIGGQRLPFRVGGFRRGQLDQLHLVELVHPNDAARFPAGGTRFPPETGRVGGKFLRQLAQRQNLLPMKIGYRHLRRGREEHLVLLQAIHVLFELRQLRGADHAIATHQEGRTHFRITVLPRVQVEHEVDEGTL